MPVKNELSINFLSPQPLTSKETGRIFLQTICEFLPELTPEHYGNWEPLRKNFSCSQLDEALENWTNPFLWKRKAPPTEGGVWMRRGLSSKHGWITFSTDAQFINQAQLIKFAQEAAVRLDIDFGFIHLLTESDIRRGLENGTVAALNNQGTRFTLGVTTHNIKKNLPELYWATIFGPPYIQLFGQERLLSPPAPVVRELSKDLIYLQLSDNLLDLKTRFSEVDTVRQRIKAHLNSNAFFDPSLPPDHAYQVPEFIWRD